MSEHELREPAEFGSLSFEVLADLIVMRKFLDNRDRRLQDLYGGRLQRSELRDNLVRSVVIEFGMGHVRHLSFYQQGLLYLGSKTAIRTEVARLESLGVVVVRYANSDRRAVTVLPSQKLIQWYSTNMPALYTEVREFLKLREGLASVEDVRRDGRLAAD